MQTITLTPYETELIKRIRDEEDVITVLLNASLGAFTVNLPRAEEMQDKHFMFIKTDAENNNITLNAAGEYIGNVSQAYIVTKTSPAVQIIADAENNKYHILAIKSEISFFA
jgi:hypothetical protein